MASSRNLVFLDGDLMVGSQLSGMILFLYGQDCFGLQEVPHLAKGDDMFTLTFHKSNMLSVH